MAMSLFIIVNYKEMKKKMISKNLIIKMNIDIDLNYTFNIGIIFKI